MVSRYLEAIYYILSEGEVARSARLADWLGVSRPTVTVALRRMSRDGMVRVAAGKRIELTEKGEAEAAAIVRRHRIVERWLTDHLGLDWVRADEEAARLEHAISEEVEHRLYESLGRPRSCPHGNPLPGISEVDPAELTLAALETHQKAVVSRISEVAEREAPALLAYLGEKKLVPGALVEILERDQVGRIIRLAAAGKEVTLSMETANRVWVVPERAHA